MQTSNKLALFTANAETIRREFRWHSALTKRLSALLYAQKNRRINCDSIQRCLDLIKEHTGVFSTFRGNMVLSIATLLSLSPDPHLLFQETLQVYTLLKGAKLRVSDYLVVAAYEIASQASPSNYATVVERTRAFYDGMKTKRFFSTGQDDYIFAAMLGLSDLDVTEGVARIEQLHSQLKGEFHNRNSIQALSQVLVLGGSDEDSLCCVLTLRDAFRTEKLRLDKCYTLPTLGILALLPVELDTIVRDIKHVQQVLRTKKGFGPWSVSKQELLLFAAAIAAGDYAQNIEDGILTATLSTSITNIIIAQQVAMIAAISASTAAAAASC